MQNSLIDYSDDDLQKGFRLHRLEVFNWGTFNQKVWKIEPLGFNSLLTGDIGSGKSTLVDAITTLLVPPNKITYNKAAGAERKERTLKSYVLGEHKNERSEYNNSKPVYLRTEEDYSVILGYFFNRGYGKGLTLAQVFWIKNGTVDKIFVTSERDLNIKDHFSLTEDTEILSLKKRIKELEGTYIFDNFKDYSNKFRPFFGISSEKVMELFFQTVSMKSIGKLTEFMRNHMLEETDIKSQIGEMIKYYEDLTKSYEAVQKAKNQLQQLEPLVEEINKYKEVSAKINELHRCMDYLPFFFADKKDELLQKEINVSNQKYDTLIKEIKTKSDIIDELIDEKIEVSKLISNNEEGQQIQRLKDKIKHIEEVKESKQQKEKEYSKLCSSLGILRAENAQIFEKSVEIAKQLLGNTEKDLDNKNEERFNISSLINAQQEESSKYEFELESLNKRKTKIPHSNLEIRNSILEGCCLESIEVPFVGELIQVKSSEREWEGALERLLHNFGLSVLVSEKDYRTISNYVNQTNLRGRLVYYKVPGSFSNVHRREPAKTSVINKLEIKEDSEFYDWIENELLEKFDFVCCDSIEQFQEENKAVTKKGQIKGSRGRHEKDDRTNISNQREYVLGWSNQEKIDSIREQLVSLNNQIQNNTQSQQSLKDEESKFRQKIYDIKKFLEFSDFSEIDWKKDANEIERLKQEIEDLEQTSDKLRTLIDKLKSIEEQIKIENEKKSELAGNKGKIEGKIADYKEKSKECEIILSQRQFKEKKDLPDISEYLHTETYNVDSIDKELQDTLGHIYQKRRSSISQKERFGQNMVVKMSQYKSAYPEETVDILPVIESIAEYIQIYHKLKDENLPKYEEKFKNNLHEGTIKEIALFKRKLEDNANRIEKNIQTINSFLRQLEYNRGTYIELISEKAPENDIKEFKEELRNCLANTFGKEEIYNEVTFHKVKKLLDKFNGTTPAEVNWINRVTDVRNWLIFSAAEKSFSDNTEKEFYSDSSGKSGGQKEKLAYTILASALAYRFGPAGNQPESKSFRFVIIDEAFGRGSDESTRYGLELFQKLNLQLLIVTPLQKIHIIENYINCVHVVENITGEHSKVRDVTIEQYKEDKISTQNVVAV